MGGRDIKFLEPCDETAMFRAQNRGDISDANHLTFLSCQQEKPARSIGHNFLQYA